jgi:hypothetical protein
MVDGRQGLGAAAEIFQHGAFMMADLTTGTPTSRPLFRVSSIDSRTLEHQNDP